MGVFARLRDLPALAMLAIGLLVPAPHAGAADTKLRPSAPAQTATVEPICDVFANGYDLVGATPCAGCFDSTINFDETDVDCGGTYCKACAVGEGCTVNADCTTGLCNTGVCVASVCGNSIVELGEVCDDGNTVNETSCPYGQASCQRCNSTCTTTLNLIGPYCGDGNVDFANGEVCDDGNIVDETSCPYGQAICAPCNSTCSATLNLSGPYCGDGTLDFANGEVCDDGNIVDETSCPYGQANCVTCNSTCTAPLNLTGAYCGDGNTDFASGEVCDDGNNVDETSCPIGQPTCTACNSTCTAVLYLTGPTVPTARSTVPTTRPAKGE